MRSLYVAGVSPDSGKTLVTLGLVEMLRERGNRVGFFRPIVGARGSLDKRDTDIELVVSHFGLDIPYTDTFGYSAEVANTLISLGKVDQLIEGIVAKHERLAESCSLVICEGIDVGSLYGISELELNALVCRDLGCPLVLVCSAANKSSDEVFSEIEFAAETFRERNCSVLTTFVNQTAGKQAEVLLHALARHELSGLQRAYALPHEASLREPTVKQIADALNAEAIAGKGELARRVSRVIVGAARFPHLLSQLRRGSLIVTAGDRGDILEGCLMRRDAKAADIAGILLADGLDPDIKVLELAENLDTCVPILKVDQDTLRAAMAAERMSAGFTPEDSCTVSVALALFRQSVDTDDLAEKTMEISELKLTPKRFECRIVQTAKRDLAHIVLPEGEEERVLRAASTVSRDGLAQVTLLGDEQAIRKKQAGLGVRLDGVQIVDPRTAPGCEAYAEALCDLRKHKGMTLEAARELILQENYFGTMMVARGDADGMVSGAVHSTGETIRPALQIIKTLPDISVVSSVFFMGINDSVMVYGDCAVNPNPTADQLAEIAVVSAQTAMHFGIDPVVAMLSYSTGRSATGPGVDRVREATEKAVLLASRICPGLPIDGPIQYDAAVEASVAATKMPDSRVAGKATVFIFPDLNTGNNTYKAVQRTAGAVATGPVLQGLRRPVNDLSRGCSVRDIVNMVTITAVQSRKLQTIQS